MNKRERDAYEAQIKMIKNNNVHDNFSEVDPRYNVSKEAPKASNELVKDTIIETEIYRRARIAVLQHMTIGRESKTAILHVQRKQVAYGLDKYPEPLNPNTWSINETVDHIMDESIDKLHYLIMLRIKLEQQLASVGNDDIIEFRRIESQLGAINRMIEDTISHMDYLVTTCEAPHPDSMDAIRYSLAAGVGIDSNKITLETPIEHSMMHGYAKADVEATQRMFETLKRDNK
jgi:hypothetical protein